MTYLLPSTCPHLSGRKAANGKLRPARFCAGQEGLHVILLREVSAADASSRGRKPAAVDLSVQIGALRLRNPILAASGTFGYGLEFAHLVDLNRLGGFVTSPGNLWRAPRAPGSARPPPVC